MNSKIETGCLAITHSCLNPDNNGIVVTVGQFLGEYINARGDMWAGHDFWEIDKIMMSTDGLPCRVMNEHKLTRIDGGDFSHEEQETAVERTAKA
jgi:hypothetical protein